MSDQVEIPNIDDLPDMTETATFTPAIKLMTTETPVLGYDGTDINPANWQAKALADRTQWLRDRLLNLSTRLVLSVNGKTGNVVVTYNDVGADAAGTADGLMTAHLTALDPHSQYFDETRGDTRYVQRTLANQSNGWLQLDAAGKIPAAMLQTLASRYVVVANQAARLALASSANLTICAQADIDQLFYLNGGDNPAVAANWVAGQSATVSGVSSVFGRTGAVTAQNGDYDADKITETATRKFSTPAEKTAWNAKQAALVSGTNIRSIFGNSLLGSGNLTPTPAQMGAAATVHTHTTADVTDYTQKTQQLITASLEAGQGVTLGQNPVNGKTIISASGGGSGGGGYIVADRPGAIAGQNHVFSFSSHSEFDLTAYALKEVAGATNQAYVIDDFESASEANYSATNDAIFDGQLRPYGGQMYKLSAVNGGFYSSHVRTGGGSTQLTVTEFIGEVPTSELIDGVALAALAGVTTGSAINTDSPWLSFTHKGKSLYIAKKPFRQTISLANLASASDKNVMINGINYKLRLISGAVPGAVIPNSPNSGITASELTLGSEWDELIYRVCDGTMANYSTNDLAIGSQGRGSATFILEKSNTGRWLYRGLSGLTSIGDSYSNPTTNWGWRPVLELIDDSSGGFVLLGNSGNYYTARDGELNEAVISIPDDINYKGSIDSGVISASLLNSISPIYAVSNRSIDIQSTCVPPSQIAIFNSLVSAASWSQINSATLTATQTNSGFVRVAVTRDRVNWHVWRGGAWVDIGTLSADTVSATKLIADGMTPSDLNGINAAGWAQLFVSNNGVPDYIAFAFALDISDPATDVATIDRLTLNVNESSRWMLQTAAQVEISWHTDSVTFRTVTAGNYKLAYQIP